ncbi:hypothetical protein C1645_412851 [Glomus cerebriforme]|uniref:Sel1 domain protein repeat-containing protein n=1 Tax=Glomus cerebriforme TaxID=658196 RepID=A0A397SIQ7_9GLOM|nr:hypothetical protein C1645_412851 [Glomus cerebriforme]
MIDKIVKHYFNDLNEGKKEKVRKQIVLDYINNHKINLQEMYNWLLNNQNDSNSIYLLGYFNYHGIETDDNKQKALELYQKATNLGNDLAQFKLAKMYMDGIGVSKNYDKTFELSKKLAKNYSCGINLLGCCYVRGIGTHIDLQKAFELYQRAADLGNLQGISNLGNCYKEGFGTDINIQKAFELYQKAANSGNDVAQYNLALMYENGNGIKKDIDNAIYWYKKSFEQGNKNAQKKIENILKVI